MMSDRFCGVRHIEIMSTKSVISWIPNSFCGPHSDSAWPFWTQLVYITIEGLGVKSGSWMDTPVFSLV